MLMTELHTDENVGQKSIIMSVNESLASIFDNDPAHHKSDY